MFWKATENQDFEQMQFSKRKYKHIFFDLDRTLWDFETNSTNALRDIFMKYELNKFIPDFDAYLDEYKKNNDVLWHAFRHKQISKNELRVIRFYNTLKSFGVKDQALAEKIDQEYIYTNSRKTGLLPFTLEILEYLSKDYWLHIITNGFREVQYIKLRQSGLMPFFDKIFTSDELGSQKPDTLVYRSALSAVNAGKKESLMIGDELYIDILGAREFGIDQVFFNYHKVPHHEEVTYEVHCLSELKTLL